jgi:hypothetical protein
MVGKTYNFARMPKSKSVRMLADAERLEFNITYAVHKYKTEDFQTFNGLGCSLSPLWFPQHLQHLLVYMVIV